MPVFFLSSENVVLKEISFWPVEMNFPASGNHFVPISQMLYSIYTVFPSLGNIF